MSFLLYGANGYTGELIAREAVRRGMRPILAGRDAKSISTLASELACRSAVFSLDDQTATLRALDGNRALLNCAGPFSRTAAALLQACLAAHVHYFDITGEIDTFELAHRLSDKAERARVVICPGVGFDVVPTDCLAAILQDALPGAVSLALGFDTTTVLSRGTQRTAAESLVRGGRIRCAGVLTPVRHAYRTRDIDFGRGIKKALTIPWGDVSTAYFTTRIPRIEVYVPATGVEIRRFRMLNLIRPLLRLRAARRRIDARIDEHPAGPDEAERSSEGAYVWGEVRDAVRGVKVARVRTANPYVVTVHAALGIVAEALTRAFKPGYATPSMLMGPGFVTMLPGSSTIRLSET